MKKAIGLLLVIILINSGCTKSDSSTDEFSNSLKLGTGMNAGNFTLNGEGTVFQRGTTIYFRLESKDDIAGSTVRIAINEIGTAVYANRDYPSAQNYGHISMSSFSVANPGNYTATGTLITGNKSVASINFTVQ
jgi:hypothetical protein